MRQFFITLRESVWSRKFYEVMGSRSPREGLRYFFSLMFFTSFIITIVISIFVVPAAIFGLGFLSNLVMEQYPADLTITIEDGLASASPAEVYNLPVSSDIWSPNAVDQLNNWGISNMLVIDTSSKFENISQFSNAKTAVLLSEDSLIFKKDSGFEISSLKKFPNVTITKPFLQNVISKISSVFRFTLPLLIVFGFLTLFVFGSAMYLVLSAIAALIMWGLGALAKRQDGYKEFFTTALYAITLPILIDVALLLLGRPNGFHALTVIIVTVLVWALNVKIWAKADLPSTDVNNPPTTT